MFIIGAQHSDSRRTMKRETQLPMCVRSSNGPASSRWIRARAPQVAPLFAECGNVVAFDVTERAAWYSGQSCYTAFHEHAETHTRLGLAT